MAIKVLELHHHGIRIGPTPEAKKKAHDFYNGVLMIELHQAGTCRCLGKTRPAAASKMS